MNRMIALAMMMATVVFVEAAENDKVKDDQTALAEIAKNCTDWEVGRTAIYNLNDQTLLIEIANTSENLQMRLMAMSKLGDPVVGINFGITVPGFLKRNEGRIADGLYFRQLVNDKDLNMRITAVKQLGNQVNLAEVAKNDEDWRVRLLAIEKLEDQVLLANFAKSDKSKGIRITAVQQLVDQAVLTDVAKNDTDWLVRLFSIWKIDNQALLAEFAENDKDVVIRKEAEKRLAVVIERERLKNTNLPPGLVLPETR